MKVDACYELGYVIKKHGTKGEVSIQLDVDNPEEYKGMESVFIEINKKLVPFFIDKIQVRGDKAVVKFEDVDEQDAADELKGKGVYLPLDILPELDDGQFYYHEIIGYEVLDSKLGMIGIVTNVATSSMQDILVIDHQGHEVLIPITDDVVSEADHHNKTVRVNVPDGLLDIYLES